MKAIIWVRYPYPRNSDWIMHGLYDVNTLDFTCLLSTLLEYPGGREFRVSYEWRWND